MNWFEKFRKGLFTRTQFIVGVTITMLTTSLVVYAVQVLVGMKVFSPGTTISSADVNANFALINKMVEDTNQKFSVKVTNPQTFATNLNYSTALSSVTPLAFEMVNYDYTVGTLGHELVNMGSFTVTQSGFYDFSLSGRVSSPGTGQGYIHVYKNSNSLLSHYITTNTSGQSTKHFLEAGSVIRVRARRVYGSGTITLDPSKTMLIMHKL